MPRGGARPGAGRKPRAERLATPILDGEKMIVGWMPELLEKLRKMAMGGDVKAAIYLVDRVMGKPVALVEQESTVTLTGFEAWTDEEIEEYARSGRRPGRGARESTGSGGAGPETA